MSLTAVMRFLNACVDFILFMFGGMGAVLGDSLLRMS